MNKKTWVKPEINTLGVEKTEHGNSITNKVDAVRTDITPGFTFYSFS